MLSLARQPAAAARRALSTIALTAGVACAQPAPDAAPAPGTEIEFLRKLVSRDKDYAAAEAAARRFLATAEASAPMDSLYVAQLLDLLSEAMSRGGRRDAETRALAARAVEIKEKIHGVDPLDLARSLRNLGFIVTYMGDLDAAIDLMRRQLAIREGALGPDHPDVAMSLADLGGMLVSRQDYAEARAVLERSVAICEAKEGAAGMRTARALRLLGGLRAETHEYAAARDLFERALRINEGALGPEDPTLVRDLWSLGSALVNLGDVAGGRTQFERALHIATTKLGAAHHDTGQCMANLGWACDVAHDPRSARQWYERAAEVWANSNEPDNHALVGNLNARAWTCMETGEFAAARPLLERAQAIAETLDNPEARGVSWILGNRAIVERRLGEHERAFDFAARAQDLANERLRLFGRTLPEQQALGLVSSTPWVLDLMLTLASERSPADSQEVRRAFDATVAARGTVLAEVIARHRAATADAAIAPLARTYAANQRQLANLIVRGAGVEGAAAYRERLAVAHAASDDAEAALAARSAPFRDARARTRVHGEDVVTALPVGAALVSYVRFDRYDSGIEYAAFVIPPGTRAPSLVRLGTCATVDSLIDTWRRRILREPVSGGRAMAPEEAACRRAGVALRRCVWDPVVARAAGATEFFVVPDGMLHVVNLDALPDDAGTYLAESAPLVHYLTVERDLIPGSAAPAGDGLLALGAPDFDAAAPFAALRQPQGARGSPPASSISTRSASGDCDDFRALRFGALRATAREAAEIAALWSATARSDSASQTDGHATNASRGVVLAGSAATETAFKRQASGKRGLHLATHAFFLEGHCDVQEVAAQDARGIGAFRPSENAALPPLPAANPLHLSGLALAGANHRAVAGLDEDDGILTAEEIAALDLTGVDWAVLSACDTGLGEIRANEGVFGLRRAFEVAGVKTLIMSFWAVEDESACAWMLRLYEERFARHAGTAEAVRRANRETLRERRNKGMTTHPFYWGAFVATGE